MRGQEQVERIVRALLECTVYVAPGDPGLTMEEMIEVGHRLSLEPGEIRDAVNSEVVAYGEGGRLLPNPGHILSWLTLRWEDPEYRNFDAIDFVHAEFMALARSEGVAHAQIGRGVLVEHARSAGRRKATGCWFRDRPTLR